MSTPKQALPVKLLMSIIYAGDVLPRDLLELLSAYYGVVDYISAEMPFLYTDYYTREMGSSLRRRFIFFDMLVRPELLPDVKLSTNDVEKKYSADGKRTINIDPGYISPAHLILATGKGYTHRPYLRDGIYADLTLIFREKSFHPLPWTYPDYAEKPVMEMFKILRAKYIIQLKH